MVLLIVLETRQSPGKGSLSNHRPWWWRWKINSGSLGTLLPQQTHLWAGGDAIEFSNICLRSTTDTTSTEPINHRNGLLRTYNSPGSDESRYSYNRRLSSEHFSFKCTPRNFYWLQRLKLNLGELFFYSYSMFKIKTCAGRAKESTEDSMLNLIYVSKYSCHSPAL